MIVTAEYHDISVDNSPLRMFLAMPKDEGKNKYPAVIFYSDIFQLTGPMLRACVRLAGYGYVVAAPEIYHRIEPPGTAIPFDDSGRTRGLEDARKTPVSDFDRDCRAVLDFLLQHPKVSPSKLAAAGFCIGGHLAFRAALQPDVRATVCFYGTGIHDGKLGKDDDAGSLQRANEIKGELLMIFGETDPHIPKEGREAIRAALQQAGVKYRVKLYPAEHAFMRDEGPRYDPECTDLAFADMIHLFRSNFGESSRTASS
ncbi:MAG: dienelactone hydrolase family protein [Acidobacteria bacterium]|nr:dienelactone hydrolase family protein [Acidobacteriota bacterium]